MICDVCGCEREGAQCALGGCVDEDREEKLESDITKLVVREIEDCKLGVLKK